MEEVFETLEKAYIDTLFYIQPLLNLLSTESLEITSINIVYPTRASMCINTQVKNTNIYPYKYQRTSHIHTCKKNILDVDLTTRNLGKYWCSMMERMEKCTFRGPLFIKKQAKK